MCNLLGQKSHLGICQLLDCEPNIRLSDQREHDFGGKTVWIQIDS